MRQRKNEKRRILYELHNAQSREPEVKKPSPSGLVPKDVKTGQYSVRSQKAREILLRLMQEEIKEEMLLIKSYLRKVASEHGVQGGSVQCLLFNNPLYSHYCDMVYILSSTGERDLSIGLGIITESFFSKVFFHLKRLFAEMFPLPFLPNHSHGLFDGEKIIVDRENGETGGFRYASARAEAWPLLLGLQRSAVRSLPQLSYFLPQAIETLAAARDPTGGQRIAASDRELLVEGGITNQFPAFIPEKVIYYDIERSLWSLYQTDSERHSARLQLKECLFRILLNSGESHKDNNCSSIQSSKDSLLHYYQGLHEVVGLFLFNMDYDKTHQEASFSICEDLIRRFFSPMCAPSLSRSSAMLVQAHYIVTREDPTLGLLLQLTQLAPATHYALSWVLTWMCHDIIDGQTASFLFDLLLASDHSHGYDIVLWVAALLLRASTDLKRFIMSTAAKSAGTQGDDIDIPEILYKQSYGSSYPDHLLQGQLHNEKVRNLLGNPVLFGTVFSKIQELPKQLRSTPLRAVMADTACYKPNTDESCSLPFRHISIYALFRDVIRLQRTYRNVSAAVSICEVYYDAIAKPQGLNNNASTNGDTNASWHNGRLAQQLNSHFDGLLERRVANMLFYSIISCTLMLGVFLLGNNVSFYGQSSSH